jgi:lipopolysaccharide export system permease protein
VAIHIDKTPKQISLAVMKPDEMSISQLRDHIQSMKKTGADIGKLEVKYWEKFALPLASLVFALLGAPLGIRPHRTSSSMGLGLSILIILLYWLVWHYTTALAVQGQIPAQVGALLPNVMGIGAACLLLTRAAK